jgi:two-component system phosphate regulon sensor histidine kinase PhoR
LAKLDNGGPKLKTELVDMHELVQEVVQSFEVLLEERSGTCLMELNAAHALVNGDRMHLTNALFNLVDNAVKYSTGPPQVRITTGNDHRKLRIDVADKGIGIRKDDLGNIFERFFRVHTGNVHDVKGFGLGLHYVAETVRAHGGKVHVKSTWGEGSTFTLELPLGKPITGT